MPPVGAPVPCEEGETMKKRLMTGLLAGGLMAAMLPGVASAGPPTDVGYPFSPCELTVPAGGPNIGTVGSVNVPEAVQVAVVVAFCPP